jgi:methylthioribulose-1-phosphate dehydratase
MSGPPYDPALLRQVAGEIVSTARELAARGWTPATSSNFSMRLDEAHAAITVSGLDKGRLTEDGVMVVDLDGRPVATEQRPSAETVLHTRLYRRDAGIGCVLHTHSLVQTVASRVFAPSGGVRLEGYELAKAIAGTTTHEAVIELPVLAHRSPGRRVWLQDRGCGQHRPRQPAARGDAPEVPRRALPQGSRSPSEARINGLGEGRSLYMTILSGG